MTIEIVNECECHLPAAKILKKKQTHADIKYIHKLLQSTIHIWLFLFSKKEAFILDDNWLDRK